MLTGAASIVAAMTSTNDHEGDDDLLHRGLGFDLSTVLRRRQALKVFGLGTVGLLTLRQCGCTPGSSSSSTTSSSTATTGGSECVEIPEETAGPYPGDGSNGVNVLTQSGIVRSDIRSSFGGATGVAGGIPLTISLTVADLANGCTPLAGAAVYLWHCDREGRYSLYSQGITNENYLRGVQETDGSEQVMFTSIFPACYSGRWPHIHFEVYPSLAAATSSANAIATSQLALPEEVCDVVYATDGYQQSVSNLDQTSLSTDNVFRDDAAAHQLATVTGSVDAGYVASLALSV